MKEGRAMAAAAKAVPPKHQLGLAALASSGEPRGERFCALVINEGGTGVGD